MAKTRSLATQVGPDAKRVKRHVSLEKIKELSDLVINDSSNKNLNNAAILLNFYNKLEITEQDDVIKLRSLSLNLFKVFESVMKRGGLSLKKNQDESVVKVTKWLKLKYSTYLDQLFEYLAVVNDNEYLESFKVDILDILMRLIKSESQYFAPNKDDPYFSLPIYKRLIEFLITKGEKVNGKNGLVDDNFLLVQFINTYLSKNWDLKFYLVQELNDILESVPELKQQIVIGNFIMFFKKSIYLDFDKESCQSYTPNPPQKQLLKLQVFKTNFEKNWLLVLNKFSLLESQYKQILLILHKRIIPFCHNPTKLMDFLTESYSIGLNSTKQDGIIISILSLNGLFELMKNFNLEYPNFYQNLYLILNNQLLHLHYKSRFFRMLDLFLSSSHLPSTLIASFIKKLSKLSLTAPPSGIVIVIPFIYNLLKKHPTCMILIHNTTQYTEYTDPFDSLEQDPLKTTLLESSLWELNTIMNHYHPNVASLAKIFSQPFNKFSYNLEDFLDWNYSNLLNSELTKRFKGDISLEFEKFDKLLDHDNSYLNSWSW